MNYSHNKVRPKSRDAAKLYNYYNNQEKWDWIQIRYWPKGIAEAVIERKLNYATRFRLFTYLVGNGMDPRMARDEILEMGQGYFDASAKEHVKGLYKDLQKNKAKWTYFDERDRKYNTIDDTAPFEEIVGEKIFYKRGLGRKRKSIWDKMEEEWENDFT